MKISSFVVAKSYWYPTGGSTLLNTIAGWYISRWLCLPWVFLHSFKSDLCIYSNHGAESYHFMLNCDGSLVCSKTLSCKRAQRLIPSHWRYILQSRVAVWSWDWPWNLQEPSAHIKHMLRRLNNFRRSIRCKKPGEEMMTVRHLLSIKSLTLQQHWLWECSEFHENLSRLLAN